MNVLPNPGTQESHTVGLHHNLGPQKFPLFKTALPRGVHPSGQKALVCDAHTQFSTNYTIHPVLRINPNRKNKFSTQSSPPADFLSPIITWSCNRSRSSFTLRRSVDLEHFCLDKMIANCLVMHILQQFSGCTGTAHLPDSPQLPFPSGTPQVHLAVQTVP